MRKALQPSDPLPPDDHGVLGSLRRRGTSRHSLKAKPARETGYLRSWGTDPYLHAVTASPILGATDGGLEASPRTRRHEERWPSVLQPSGGLVPSGRWHRECSVARCPPSFESGRAIAHRACRETRTESGGQRSGTGSSKRGPPRRGERGSDARGRARASLNVAEVDRQWPAQRSGRSPFHPIWIAFRDGRLARSSTCESTKLWAKRHWHPHRGGNLHVTAFESGCEPAHGAGRCRWKASWIVVAGGSSRNACMSRSRLARRTSSLAESEARATGKRQGCQRYGGSGSARKKTPRRNPERPAEADRAS